MEYKGEISGIGDVLSRENEITAEDIATLRHYIMGWESGVISGFDSDFINLFDKRTTTDGYEIYGNVIAPNSEYFVSDYIQVKPNTIYYKDNDNMGWAIYTYDNNKQPIERENFDRNSWFWSTTNSSVKYIRFDGTIANKDKIILRERKTQITITSGLMFAYGYFGYIPKNVTLYFNPTAATQYQFVYIELSRSVIPNGCVIKVKNNQSGDAIKPTTFRQDILSAVKTGVYQLPIYRITLNSTGISEVKGFRDIPSLQGLAQLISQIKKTYTSFQTKIITESISSSAVATTQTVEDNSTKIATTEFVKKAIQVFIPPTYTTKVTISVSFGRSNISELFFTLSNYSEWQEVIITPNTNYDVGTIEKSTNIIEVQNAGNNTYQIRLAAFYGGDMSIRFVCVF